MCDQCVESDIMSDYAGESISAYIEAYVHEVLERHPELDLSPARIEVNILSKKVKDHVTIYFDDGTPHYLLNFTPYIAYQSTPTPHRVNRRLAKVLLYHTTRSVAELSDRLGTDIPTETIHLGTERPMHLGRATAADRHEFAEILDPDT